MEKIIVLTSTYYKPHYGGVENSLFYLAKEYQKAGKNVIILASDAPLSKKGRLPSSEEIEGINIVRYKRYIPKAFIDYYIKPSKDVKIIKKRLKTLSKEYNIVNVIARSPETAVAAISSKLKTSYVLPGIAKTQNHIPSNGLFDLKSFFLNKIVLSPTVKLQRKALLRANLVGAFSENMKQQVFDFLRKKIHVQIVFPGVDLDKFKPKEIQRRRDPFKFLVVGRLIDDKAVHLAVESLALVQDKSTQLVIVGDGPRRQSLQSLSEELGVQDRVIFEGKVTQNIEKKYEEADCYLMSSIRETFGQTILEGMSVGLPIIAWEKSEHVLTASSEIISEGQNGYLVEFSVEKMARCMETVAALSTEELEDIKSNNVGLIRERYTWKKLSKDLVSI